jgi:sulfur carrier protein ThiS
VRAVLSSTSADNPVNVSSLAGQVSVGEYSTTAPAVGSTGLVVRLASTGVRVINSSAADLLANVSSVAGRVLTDQNSTTWAVQVDGRVRAQNSTIGDLLASVQQNSTVWAVQVDGRVRAQNSTIGDLLASVQQNSTVWAVQVDGRVRAQNSTIGDLLASVQQNSTVWQVQAKIQDSSGVSPSVLGVVPSTSAQGLAVRLVDSGLNSTTVTITSTHSTALYSLVSSVAAARQKVTAYFIGSTHTNPSTFVFMSSNVIDRWAVNFGSGSSGITGANLAVGAPSWLFNTDAANALQCRIEGGSSVTATVVARVSISWFSEA